MESTFFVKHDFYCNRIEMKSPEPLVASHDGMWLYKKEYCLESVFMVRPELFVHNEEIDTFTE